MSHSLWCSQEQLDLLSGEVFGCENSTVILHQDQELVLVVGETGGGGREGWREEIVLEIGSRKVLCSISPPNVNSLPSMFCSDGTWC